MPGGFLYREFVWVITSQPLPNLPKMYYGDLESREKDSQQAPPNHEPDQTHEPISSSQVNHEPPLISDNRQNPVDSPAENLEDRNILDDDDSSVIRGDEHIRIYTPGEFVAAFGWGVTFTLDASGAFRDELVDCSDFLAPSHLAAASGDRWFPEQNRELPFAEYTHDSPEFQIEVPETPVIHVTPARPPPAFTQRNHRRHRLLTSSPQITSWCIK